MTDRRKMLWYDKIVINLRIAKYIWRGDGQHEKEENRTKRDKKVFSDYSSIS
jgi:hypothetical protein